ncbi:ATP-binding cassette domain-containing protein [Nesterenkonia sp. E16_7]|uniref:multiple monosaccharide ABC transporter ATP-binding protein n=1 Tax=unclassified Nesterenkonia TaxID=2629769 RepID=UPI001A938E1B|nr:MULTISPECIES: multiple monosaccharide ABC transporter ATP-binding protein [unclassified Nesterenkonia]MBO0596657.1 ATP-binding cassette domain-containing protein [Nesterenkonia sp. E16_10]MBO0597949.1 ATP-binding cassette domain-containing protein [Nesterenkonia sp. E16_7]
MNENILEMRSITKRFPGVVALQDVNLQVRRGEIHAVCGENGAGKSTLMKVLSGVHPAGTYEGEIHFESKQVSFSSLNDSEDLGIVIIHQELALVPHLSVAENIFLGNEKSRAGIINWHDVNLEAAALLDKVGLRENPVTPVGHLGVGKQQLVEIAKALSKDVKLLILDEPTAALNDDDSAHLLGLIRDLREEGVTCIIISHKLGEIAAVADSTTVIRDGSTVETIDMAEASANGEDLTRRIIRDMVGRDMENMYPERDVTLGEEVFRIEDWHVRHPTQRERKVVDGASLNVRAGEVVGIAGLMGAGRTELAMSVFGKSYGRDITGTVYMHGEPVKIETVSDAIKAGIAYVSEDRKRYGLNLIDDIRRNVSSAALKRIAPRGWINENEEIAVAERYRTSMNIKAPTVMSVLGKLSGGNQQKVVLSKWLYTEPELLILDEPTRGIDVGAKYEIYSIINKLAASGKAIIVISSELPEVLGMCDRVYTLSSGRITGQLPVEDATQERLMELMTMEKD